MVKLIRTASNDWRRLKFTPSNGGKHGVEQAVAKAREQQDQRQLDGGVERLQRRPPGTDGGSKQSRADDDDGER